MADLAPWQQRVQQERDDLKAKFDALSSFLQGPAVPTRDLLVEQHDAMAAYLQALNKRIALWE